jgi:mono/diheme cytochrome c family protein
METAYRRRMRALILAFPLWSLTAAAGTPPTLVSRPSDSAGLYFGHCAGCHGRDGKGDGPAAWQLRMRPHSFTDCGWMSMMSDATLFLIIKNGSSAAGFPAGMPANDGRLNDDEITQLVHYVRRFCSGNQRALPTP